MSLKVNMHMVTAVLQIRARSRAVAVSMPTSVFWYEGCPLLLSPSHLPTVQNNPLQYEDCEEAGGHDKLWKGETGLFETDTERLTSFKVQTDKRQKIRVFNQTTVQCVPVKQLEQLLYS